MTGSIKPFPYLFIDQTTKQLLWNPGDPALVSRWRKPLQEQKERTKEKGEVFTPVWAVSHMIDLLEGESPKAIKLSSTFLDICAGEGNFITTRYDPYTGEWIDPFERKGVLDRKLLNLADWVDSPDIWIMEATKALKAVYGYEYHADSLCLCRINVLMSMIEHFEIETGLNFDYWSEFRKWAFIITWNFIQMDGLTGLIPGTNIPAKIYDWREKKVREYNEMREV